MSRSSDIVIRKSLIKLKRDESKELECDSNSLLRSNIFTSPETYIPRDYHVNVPHVVALVGLPARGKTYIGRKLTRYLNWIGIKTQIFNLGDYRRAMSINMALQNIFTDDPESSNIRAQIAIRALEDVGNWLKNKHGDVAIFDATNTTRDRRNIIYNYVVEQMRFKLFFVESYTDDQTLIEKNIKEVKVGNLDYVGVAPEDAMADFLNRIKHYQERYQPLDDNEEEKFSFMKIIDGGRESIVYRHEGHIQARIVYFLMNIKLGRNAIYLSRTGETEYNVRGILGGDSLLTENGKQYAKELARYIKEQDISNLRVWTSWLKSTIQTGKFIDAPQERFRSLNEISPGLVEDMTAEEFEQKFPDEFALRQENKLTYRYPKGESYEDVVSRLEPIIMELERQESILVISHHAVMRCLLAYFQSKSRDELPYIDVPLHTVFKLTPAEYGCKIEEIVIPIKAVHTDVL